MTIRDYQERGKSGQHRVPYFLTGRVATGDGSDTESATENKPPFDKLRVSLE